MLKNVYLSSKMMKFHPLMTKELRKSYSLMAATALRAMPPEFKYGVKKYFSQMCTALKAMSTAELKQRKLFMDQSTKRILWEG